MEPLGGAPIETLRISDKEKAKLIWAMNESVGMSVGEDPSRLRVTAAHTNAVISMAEKGSQPLDFSVVAYSHGRYGISVLHGRYVHPDSRCKIRFQSLRGEWHERTGHTGQCIHVQGLIHAMLIVFDEPINLDEFAMLTSEQETRHLQEIAQELPHMDEQEFEGLVSKVLFVDDVSVDRKLVSHWLNRSGMQVTTVAASGPAYEQIEKDQFDLLVVDIRLAGENGADVIREVRTRRFVQPILAVSADDTEETRDAALAAGANAFLAKPMTEEQLARTAKELMGFDADGDEEPIFSTLSNDDQMVPLITGYTRSLASKITSLREANANNDYEKLQHDISALKGSGTSYGFPDITAAATAALAALDADLPDMDEIKKLTNTLVLVLSRVKPTQQAS